MSHYAFAVICITLAVVCSSYAQCPDNPCGIQASCRLNTAGVPVCSCPFGYLGDPFKECIKPQCLNDGDCIEIQGCRKGECVDPCVKSCGKNAACKTDHHVPVCYCPEGFTGSPFVQCDPL